MRRLPRPPRGPNPPRAEPQSAGTAQSAVEAARAVEAGMGFAVLQIREIIRLQKITPVPQLPADMKGVINLRDRVSPVIDLRVKFGLDDTYTERTCIVVVQLRQPQGSLAQMGLIVDGVEEVVTISGTEIEPTPDFSAGVDTRSLVGMAKIKGAVILLLDLDRVLTADGLAALAHG